LLRKNKQKGEILLKMDLIEKIKNHSALLGVIGLGYVGLPLAVEKAKAGYKVHGFDIQKEKVDMVNAGKNYIGDIVDCDLSEMVKKGSLCAGSDYSKISEMDCICICVPTPLDKHMQPDITYVQSSASQVAKYAHKDMLVVLESTTYPGTTQEIIKPMLEQKGFTAGKDIFIAFSPERVDPGNKLYKVKNTPKVVGGVTPACTEVAKTLYENVLNAPIHTVSSPAVAEMEKLLENTFRNINIGLANEMAILCDRMGINVWEVIGAAATKPYGFMPFYPGPGLGGHCIPIDPFYLTWKAKEYNYHTRLIETASEINTYMPEFVVERCARVLNMERKPLNGSKILVLGVAYKQDIDDYRESPALEVIDLLEQRKAFVDFYDPHIAEYKYKGMLRRGKAQLHYNELGSYDLVVITTMHTAYDYEEIQRNAVRIVDTKNAMKQITNRNNIELL
jgi:UDP-N-acetyl-D-glucosamine dehydrogenase